MTEKKAEKMSRNDQLDSSDKLHQTLPKGVASLFSGDELRKFFTGFLIMTGVLEGFLFFLCWISYLSTDTDGFPWRIFILAAFVTPLLLTLLLALIVVGFNHYVFVAKEPDLPAGEAEKPSSRMETFWAASRRMPFLAGLLLLVLGAGLVFRLDAITAFIANAGEAAFRYLFISLGVLLAVATLFGLLWMVFAYKLRRQRMEHLFRYKQEVMEQTGMIILEDDTVIDRNGRLIEHCPADHPTRDPDDGKIAFLPKFPRS